jgi:tripartite-type tricarboxylate transporter receptor subunit TctC
MPAGTTTGVQRFASGILAAIGLGLPTLLACGLIGAPAAQAESVQEFYSKNKLNIIVGVPPGGSYDLNARLVARLLQPYLPGHPSAVIQNMPGANTTLAANYIHNVAAQDGTVIGSSSRTMPYATLMGSKGVRYDPLKINWIGSTAGESAFVVSWHTSPVQTTADLFEKELIVGSTDTGGDLFVYPNVLNHVIGTKFKMVMGYRGNPEISIAMERGEVQGMGSYSAGGLFVEHKDWLKEKKINLLMQLDVARNPDYPDLPLPTDFAKTEEQRQILQIFLEMKRFAYPFFVGPNVPAERVAALRAAMTQVEDDPEFKAEQVARGRELSPASGEVMTAAIHKSLSLPDAVRDQVRAIMGQ